MDIDQTGVTAGIIASGWVGDQIYLVSRGCRGSLKQIHQFLSGKIGLFSIYQDIDTAFPVHIDRTILINNHSGERFEYLIQAALFTYDGCIQMIRHFIRLYLQFRQLGNHYNLLDILIGNGIRHNELCKDITYIKSQQ